MAVAMTSTGSSLRLSSMPSYQLTPVSSYRMHRIVTIIDTVIVLLRVHEWASSELERHASRLISIYHYRHDIVCAAKCAVIFNWSVKILISSFMSGVLITSRILWVCLGTIFFEKFIFHNALWQQLNLLCSWISRQRPCQEVVQQLCHD